MGAPHKALDHNAAFGRFAEQLRDGRSLIAHLLVGVAAPVGEEEIVAFAQRLYLADQAVEVGCTVNQRLGAVTCTPDGNRGGRVSSLIRGEEPIGEFRHANRITERRHR
jgi:hypothetical protein